jgi:8-oxo-dGTP diphosphatase
MSPPSHAVSAGVFLVSPAARFLMVQTFNRLGAGLVLPGGMVETGESATAGAEREVAEELGLQVAVHRLLAVEHRTRRNGRPSSIHLVFAAAGTVEESADLTLQPEEIAEVHWVHRDDVIERHVGAGQLRMQAALTALDSGTPGYLET